MSFRIGVLQLSSSLDDTVSGFKAGLVNAGIPNDQYEIDYRNVQENVPSFGQEADDLVSTGVDLIFACTTPAAKFAKESTEFLEIPVVFAPVYDPVAVGLAASWSGSACHLAGVSGKVEVAEKIALMQRLRPGLKTVTVAYDPNDPNALLEMNEFADAAQKAGISATYLKLTSPSSFAQLAFPDECQFVFVPICRMLENHFSAFATACTKRNLPVCGPNVHTVKAGAACCIDSGHYQLGMQAGHIAARILRGESPGLIPIERPAKAQVFVNGRVLNGMGLMSDSVSSGFVDLSLPQDLGEKVSR